MNWLTRMLMQNENDEGSGGEANPEEVDTEVEDPKPGEGGEPAPEPGSGEPAPPAPTPPPQPDTVTQQIQSLLEQNRQLAAQLQAQGRSRPDPEDDEKLEPEVERIIARRIARAQASTQQMIAQLADQQDQTNFTQVIKDYGYEQKLVDEAKSVYVNWRRAGVNATREDALLYVVGRNDAAVRRAKGSRAPAPPPPPKPPNPHATLERQGGRGAPVSKVTKDVALEDTPKTEAERRKWIEKFEAKQDKAGGF